MTDVECAHLRPASTPGGGHGEAHLVVDIHERERTRGISTRPAHVRAARPQRRELITDAAVVDDCKSAVAGEIVVVLFDSKVEKSFRQGQIALDPLDRSESPREGNQPCEFREMPLPAIQPDAADALALMVAM